MKYIMIETNEGEKIPVIFAESLVHANVAEVMVRAITFERTRASDKTIREHAASWDLRVVSAGFVSFPITPTVAGESESLDGIKSRPLDGFRMQAGASVAHMPDRMLYGLAQKAEVQAKEPYSLDASAERYKEPESVGDLAAALTEKMAALEASLACIKGEPEYPHRLQQFLFRLLRDHPEIDYAAHLAQTEHEVAVYDTEAIDIAQAAEFLASELAPR
jgi:hypothetical protein